MRVSTACSIRRQPCLSQTRLAELAALSRQAVQLFGAAQNIEWALASDRLWLLQSRPLTG
jgi:pyruvate,water dikinase